MTNYILKVRKIKGDLLLVKSFGSGEMPFLVTYLTLKERLKMYKKLKLLLYFHTSYEADNSVHK